MRSGRKSNAPRRHESASSLSDLETSIVCRRRREAVAGGPVVGKAFSAHGRLFWLPVEDVQAPQVVGKAHEGPLGGYFLDVTQQELPESHRYRAQREPKQPVETSHPVCQQNRSLNPSAYSPSPTGC